MQCTLLSHPDCGGESNSQKERVMTRERNRDVDPTILDVATVPVNPTDGSSIRDMTYASFAVAGAGPTIGAHIVQVCDQPLQDNIHPCLTSFRQTLPRTAETGPHSARCVCDRPQTQREHEQQSSFPRRRGRRGRLYRRQEHDRCSPSASHPGPRIHTWVRCAAGTDDTR